MLPPPLVLVVLLDTVRFDGQVINVGLMVSLCRTVTEHVAVLPLPSVAVITTVVDVTVAAMIVPAGGDCVFVTGEQLSVAVAVPARSGITVVHAIAFL